MRLALTLLLLTPAPIAGQLHLTARAGWVAHGAHALDRGATDEPSFRPGTAGEYAVAAGLDHGDWRIAVAVRRAPADLVLRGREVGILTPDALAALGVAVEIGHRLAGRRDRPVLHLIAGVERIRWSFGGLDDPPRGTWGGLAALEGTVPIGGRLATVVRVGAARSGSLFDADVLPEGYRRQASWRVGMGAGVRVSR